MFPGNQVCEQLWLRIVAAVALFLPRSAATCTRILRNIDKSKRFLKFVNRRSPDHITDSSVLKPTSFNPNQAYSTQSSYFAKTLALVGLSEFQ